VPADGCAPVRLAAGLAHGVQGDAARIAAAAAIAAAAHAVVHRADARQAAVEQLPAALVGRAARNQEVHVDGAALPAAVRAVLRLSRASRVGARMGRAIKV
jgi:hypothetical protein